MLYNDSNRIENVRGIFRLSTSNHNNKTHQLCKPIDRKYGINPSDANDKQSHNDVPFQDTTSTLQYRNIGH